MATQQHGFRKELRLRDLTMASLGGLIGSGWLFGAMSASNAAGPAAILSWILGGIAVLFIGLVYAELGGMLPKTGGVVSYPHLSHGSLTSYLMGWASWIAYATVAPIEAEAVTQYAANYVPGLFAAGSLTMEGRIVSFALLALFVVINLAGVKFFANVNTGLTYLKLAVPVLAVVVLFFAGFHPGNLVAQGGFMPFGWSGVLSAIATSGVIFSYLGFRQAVEMAGEAKNPQRDVPLAILIALGIAIVLYVALQVVFLGALPASALAHGWAKVSFSAPFADLAKLVGVGWLAFILFVDAIYSPGGTGIVYTASTSRVLYAFQANGTFFPFFGKLNKQGVPYVALITNLILGSLTMLNFPGWGLLVGVVSGAVVVTYIVGPVSAMVLRRTARDLNRPFRLGGMGVIAPAAYAVASLIIYWNGWPTTGEIMLFMLAGLVFYVGFFFSRGWDARELVAGLWLVAQFLFLTAMSYLGTFGTGKGIIPAPWDTLLVIVGSLITFYWGVASGIPTAEIETILDEQRTPNVSI